MATTFTAIDLSRLPPPDIIEPLSYEDIRAEMLAKVVELIPDFDATLESDPAVKVLEVCSYFRLLDRQRVNDTARALFLASAQKSDLDQIGANGRVARLTLVPADPDAGTPAVMESDDDYRARIALGPEAYSVAGPTGAYEFFAKSADSDVLDARAVSPSPACVDVYVLSRTGNGTASADLIATVAAALSGENVRPIGDRVTVNSAEIIDYSIAAVVHTFAGPDYSVVLAEAQRRVEAYRDESRRLGRDVTRFGIFAALGVAGVQNATLSEPPDDIVCDESQAGNCTGISIIFAGTGE